MQDAVRLLHLVTPSAKPSGSTQTYACSTADAVRTALQHLAMSGGPAYRVTGFRELSETWFDTADRRVLRSGLVLRVVHREPDPIARLTAAPAPVHDAAGDDGLAQVVEADEMDAALRKEGPVGDRVRAVAGARPLEPVVTVITRRSEFEAGPGTPTLALTLDEVRVKVPEREVDPVLCRLTIRAARADEQTADALAASLATRCDLAPAPPFADSVLESAAVDVPGEVDVGPVAIDPSISVAGLAFACLRRHARAFLRHEPGTRLGDDPEALHDMRVASRRMRAALSLFEPYLPGRVRALRSELGRIGRILGAVRDLDVQLEQLAAWRAEGDEASAPAFDAVEAILTRRRAAARRRMLAALDAARYERFTGRMSEALRSGPGVRPATGKMPARSAAPELIRRRYRALRKIGDALAPDSAAVDYHAARIRAKRLRYALEFHHPLYDGDVKAMIEQLTALQDLLGEHQDAHVSVAHIAELATGRRRALPQRALFLMGTISAGYEHRAAELRRRFPKVYRKIRGKRWKALKHTLAAGRAPGEADPR